MALNRIRDTPSTFNIRPSQKHRYRITDKIKTEEELKKKKTKNKTKMFTINSKTDHSNTIQKKIKENKYTYNIFVRYIAHPRIITFIRYYYMHYNEFNQFIE